MKNIILILVLGSLFTHCAESTFEETPEKIRETYPNSEDMGGQEDSSPTNKDTADKDTSDENTEDAVSNPLDSSGSCQDLCTENAIRCTESVLEKCVRLTTCTEWKVENCPENQACMDGACVEVEACVDNDQDGYGPHCQKGPDCNDNDNAIHPGATEKCDNLDNDCDTNIDEDFTLGAVCSIGQGRCEKSGFIQCAANGTETSCSAQATAPDLEICDGIDNDCDGMIDEGDACNFCNGDGNEPNNTPTSATPLPADQPYWSAVCPGDTDYFSVTTTPNQSYRFSIQFPEAFSDLKLKGFGNGMLQGTADHAGDALNLYWKASAGTNYTFEVSNKETKENIYYVSFQNQTQLSCNAEDAFAPNQSINTAPILIPTWRTQGYICSGTKDWYKITNIQLNDSIYIEANGLGFGAADIDIVLYGDADGDLSFNVLETANSLSASEYIRFNATYTGTYYFYIEAPNDLGEYDVLYTH